jgi:hypothetical protein
MYLRPEHDTRGSPENDAYSVLKIVKKYFPICIDTSFKTNYIIIIDNDNNRKFKHNR